MRAIRSCPGLLVIGSTIALAIPEGGFREPGSGLSGSTIDGGVTAHAGFAGCHDVALSRSDPT